MINSEKSDTELYLKVRKTSEKIAENMHIVANDPSMAFYRIQEHVRKVLPPIVEKRAGVVELQNNLQGSCYDLEYSNTAVKNIESSDKIFKNVHELLKNAIFLKQQLKYEEIRRNKKESQQNSVYKRLSAHLTLDLPDLPDLSGVVRETTNRVEHMMSSSSTKNSTNLNNASGTTAATTTTGNCSTNVSIGNELQRSHTTLH